MTKITKEQRLENTIKSLESGIKMKVINAFLLPENFMDEVGPLIANGQLEELVIDFGSNSKSVARPLTMEEMTKFQEAISANGTIKKLVFHSDEMTQDLMAELAVGLKNSSSIEELHIQQTEITGDVATEFANMLETRDFKKLALFGNKIADVDAEKIVDAIKSNAGGIEHLEINQNDLTDASMAKFAEIRGDDFSSLNVWGNKVTGNGLKELFENPQILNLEIGTNDIKDGDIDADFLQKLESSNIQDLSISGNEKLTETGVEKIVKAAVESGHVKHINANMAPKAVEEFDKDVGNCNKFGNAIDKVPAHVLDNVDEMQLMADVDAFSNDHIDAI